MSAKEYNCLVATLVPVLGYGGSTSGALQLSGVFFLFFNRTLSEAQGGFRECVRELLQWNASVNALPADGFTALHLAVKNLENRMLKKRLHYLCKGSHFDFNLTLRSQHPGKFFFLVRPPLPQCGGDASLESKV